MVGAGKAEGNRGIGVTILKKNEEEAVIDLMIGKTHTYRIYRQDRGLSTGKWPAGRPAATAWPGIASDEPGGGGAGQWTSSPERCIPLSMVFR
jgi:hypothetical protein